MFYKNSNMIFHDFGVPHRRGGCWGQGGGDPQGVYPILEGGDTLIFRQFGLINLCV